MLTNEPTVAETAIQGKFIATSNLTKSVLLIVNNLQDITQNLV